MINNAVLEKNIGIVRKHRDIKLVTNEARVNDLKHEPNYYSTKHFSKNSITLGLMAAVTGKDAVSQKKILGSSMTLLFSNEEMDNIIKIVKSLQESGL